MKKLSFVAAGILLAATIPTLAFAARVLGRQRVPNR